MQLHGCSCLLITNTHGVQKHMQHIIVHCVKAKCNISLPKHTCAYGTNTIT